MALAKPGLPTVLQGTELDNIDPLSGYLPLHQCLVDPRRSSFRILQLLQAYPDAVHHRLPNGRVALHLAARHNDAIVVQAVLDHDPAAIRTTTTDGRLPLDYAITGTASLQVITALLHVWEESRNLIDANGESFLTKAISNARDTDIVEAFCTPELLSHVNIGGQTILHHAILERKMDHVDLILKKAPHLVSKPDASGMLPLHTAARLPHFPSRHFGILLKLYPDALQIPCLAQGNLPLHCMLCHGGSLPQVSNVRFLVNNYPAALKVRNLENQTPIEVFYQTAGFFTIQSYKKAQAIAHALLDPQLPFHDIAKWYHCIPDSVRAELWDTFPAAITRRDEDGFYAWQVAATHATAPLSYVYDLLRPALWTALPNRRHDSN